MSSIYTLNCLYIVVKTCAPGAGNMWIGSGKTLSEALELSVTPFGGHEDEETAIRTFVEGADEREGDDDDDDFANDGDIQCASMSGAGGAFVHELESMDVDDLVYGDMLENISGLVAAGLMDSPLQDASDISDANIETEEEWYDSLGEHWTDEDGGQVEHPVCDFDEVEDFEPNGDLEEKALAYARDAAKAAKDASAAVGRAIRHAKMGDLDGVLYALQQASDIESNYGDEPMTQAATIAIFRDGWSCSNGELER